MTSGNARRFTPDQIRAIRAARVRGVTVAQLARHYGVSHSTIENIVYRWTYRDIPDFVNHKQEDKNAYQEFDR